MTASIKRKIDSAKLAKIISANVMCWLHKHKEWFKEKWRIKKSAGPLGINLVHHIDFICYFLGTVKYV
jgi:predicted dehydrogenase